MARIDSPPVGPKSTIWKTNTQSGSQSANSSSNSASNQNPSNFSSTQGNSDKGAKSNTKTK